MGNFRLIFCLFILSSIMTGCVSYRKQILEQEGIYWSQSVQEMIKQGKITIGMTKSQVVAACDCSINWIHKSRMQSVNGTLETWTLYTWAPGKWTTSQGKYDRMVQIHFDYSGRVSTIFD